jgi:putative transposase
VERGHFVRHFQSSNKTLEIPPKPPHPALASNMKPHRSVYETIRFKRGAEPPPTPEEALFQQEIGSKGWHTRGYLPHHDKPGTIQMVTFRLADAMPSTLRHEWEPLLAIKNQREQQTKLEEYLDRGYGECVLKHPHLAIVVENTILRFNEQRYRVISWVIMPNHAHVLFEQWQMPLGKLLKGWKGASASSINRILGRSGRLWQEDYWDRYIRDELHFRKAQHYIEWNPVKAGLTRAPSAWPYTSAHPKWHWTQPHRYLTGELISTPHPS